MAKTLKVYGFIKNRFESERSPNGSAQTRNVVAAHSVAEVLRLASITRAEYNWNGCVTGNADEIEIALSEPGVVFWTQPDERHRDASVWQRDDSGLRSQEGTAS